MKLNKISYLLPLTAIAMAGCATNSYQSDIDSGKFVQAKSADAVGSRVVREYVPVPVPGQLRPVPNTEVQKLTQKSVLTKEAAVAEANKNAQEFPDQNDFFNAMMTYSYMPGAMYTIYTAPLNITDIIFEPEEKIISQAAGDTLRWQIASTYSGEGKDLRWHILVKPQKTELNNSMIVTTNKRTYHLILKSVSADQAMVSVKWQYPSAMVQGLNGGLDLSLSNMSFNYHWSMLKGDTPKWYPEQVFSSGHQTFIKFPHEVVVGNATMPVPFVQSNAGEYGTANFNWRMKGDYMVIDTVIKDAYLKTGTKESGETVVQISQK